MWQHRAGSAVSSRITKPADAPGSTDYDIFLFYSHDADGRLAPELQRGLERFAKPWRQKRALRVFRDAASLSAAPRLWSSIEQALGASAWFVLLASPRSAASPWVNREVAWWLEHRSADRLLLVVTDGAIVWDGPRNDINWAETSALPRALRGRFVDEPRWVDGVVTATRPLEAVVADVASAVRGVAKDELYGDHLREHRQTMRRAVGAISSLAVLLVLVLILSVISWTAQQNALRQANAANARQLAAEANDHADTRLDITQLLAVQALRLDPNPQTRAALIRAVTANSALFRFLALPAPITALAGTDDGSTALAGLQDGRVLRWRVDAATPETVLTLSEPVNHLATDATGRTVFAASTNRSLLARPRRPAIEIPVHPGFSGISDVTVSPSGDHAAAAWSAQGDGPGAVVVIDVPSGGQVVHSETIIGLTQMPNDEELLTVNIDGLWTRRRTVDWSNIAGESSLQSVRYGVRVAR